MSLLRPDKLFATPTNPNPHQDLQQEGGRAGGRHLVLQNRLVLHCPASSTRPMEAPRAGLDLVQSNLDCKRQSNAIQVTMAAPSTHQSTEHQSHFPRLPEAKNTYIKINPSHLCHGLALLSPQTWAQPLSCSRIRHIQEPMAPPTITLGRQRRGKHKTSDRQSCQSGPDPSKD